MECLRLGFFVGEGVVEWSRCLCVLACHVLSLFERVLGFGALHVLRGVLGFLVSAISMSTVRVYSQGDVVLGIEG